MGTLFDIKSHFLQSTVLLLRTDALEDVAASLLQRFGPDSQSSGFFDDDPVVLDFQDWDIPPGTALDTLFAALRSCRMRPVAYRSISPALAGALEERGLFSAPAPQRRVPASATPTASTNAEAAQGHGGESAQPAHSGNATTAAAPTHAAPTANTEQAADIAAAVAPPEPPVGPLPPVVVRKPLRSGQKVYARSADLLLLCPVHSGAEAVADGSIYSYAPLKGRAIAGARGDTQARIVTTYLDAELVCIAGVYCTLDGEQASGLRCKPAQVWLSEDGQERLVFDSLGV
ncbi:septum site-determining protein MinC [Candidatus Symbiobacter mobilis]|uniref:Probable septum site-determining protein MinC n=1 Tax=Candidatus Symbiobacter mobilis CR TaxID=946483 RepID=U5N9C9_9BURK|nr:septum site-determining protein MinC [Candidatus Symbiobacter mobilis]AGX88007.1 septum site-determining protein MinC [Candidatus Symbiobacter mobilis CR]